MIYFHYSADYELFLGGNHLPPEQVMVAPTAELLARCDDLDIPLTLFVDTECLRRHAQWGETAFVDAVQAQLRAAVAAGHDAQAHLHPHWSQTERDGPGFRFPPHRYALGTLDNDSAIALEEARGLIARCRDDLESLLKPVNPDYACVAFRAGGYALQPYEREILALLAQAGLRIDSSVIPGYRDARVDFRQVADQAGYWVDPEAGLNSAAEAGAGLFEIPIASATLPDAVARRALWRAALRRAMQTLLGGQEADSPRGWPVGGGAQGDAAERAAPGRLKQAWWNFHAVMNQRFARLELKENPELLLAVTEAYLATRNWAQEPVFLSLNCHPKGLHGRHLRALERFHRGLRRRYGSALRCHTFAQSAQMLLHKPGQ
ncbi:hypothetical protein [Magnetofaba australis]|uniref:Polysaccharide deacetylase n=1 Tax=Magnetofaba australis IT-1 TaxID=1434232 RepID=A0A1Y2K0K9_9PROT|nr:hypothetical protein [Magnetofaba australis]OSM01509.1 hypothetical protein MAIT1_01495 [Magnetofaba australis IT-1]